MVKVESFENKELALEKATAKLNTVLAHSVEKPVLLFLSGGSSLALLEGLATENLNSKTTIAVLDERYSSDPKVNNFAQIVISSFYLKAKERGAHFIDTRIQNGESQEDLAIRFNNALTKWFHTNPNGVLVATAGIGPDGHTAGMIPNTNKPKSWFHSLFDNGQNSYVASYTSEQNEYPKRVTTTLNLMRKIDDAIIYAVGENKREAINHMIDSDANLSETPARILNEIADAIVFTDLKI